MSTRGRRRRRIPEIRIERLLRLCRSDQFPASMVIRRRGGVVARLIIERDYQEMAQLMAEHLEHLANEAEQDAIPLEEALNWLRQRREARRLARGSGE